MLEQQMIEITINGQPKTVPVGSRVTDLLSILKLETRAIAVEVNQNIVPSETFAQQVITAGDVLEIVTLVGGG